MLKVILLRMLLMKSLRLVVVLFAILGQAQAQVASERQLREVQKEIAALAEKIQRQTRERDSETAALGDIEKRLASAELRRREIDAESAAVGVSLQQTEQDIVAQQRNLAVEQKELGRQLRTAYTSGRQERIKLVLNQQSPAELGRMLTYYRYLNNARIGNMDKLRAALLRLQQLRDKAEAQRASLAALARENDQVVAGLNADRKERQTLLTQLDQRIRGEEAIMVELNRREKELSDLLAELASILDDYPTGAEEPLTSMRGSLTWPVAGALRSNFGDSRAGGNVRSKGLVLATERGVEVRAIYHGRVVYADWLPGMGLLTIVDHGEGLISLYGYNETLQKSVGDWIAPGEVIATVGNSGGQPEPALYFELRKGTKALNPRPWFKQRPGGGRR
ncbi:MAG: murein hydrolase activator EnvC [Woeseiaceae bacterium]